jgi:hypothetical protein
MWWYTSPELVDEASVGISKSVHGRIDVGREPPPWSGRRGILVAAFCVQQGVAQGPCTTLDLAPRSFSGQLEYVERVFGPSLDRSRIVEGTLEAAGGHETFTPGRAALFHANCPSESSERVVRHPARPLGSDVPAVRVSHYRSVSSGFFFAAFPHIRMDLEWSVRRLTSPQTAARAQVRSQVDRCRVVR